MHKTIHKNRIHKTRSYITWVYSRGVYVAHYVLVCLWPENCTLSGCAQLQIQNPETILNVYLKTSQLKWKAHGLWSKWTAYLVYEKIQVKFLELTGVNFESFPMPAKQNTVEKQQKYVVKTNYYGCNIFSAFCSPFVHNRHDKLLYVCYLFYIWMLIYNNVIYFNRNLCRWYN